MSPDIQVLIPIRPPVAAMDMMNRIFIWAMREWYRAALAREPVTRALRNGLEKAGMPELAGPMSRMMAEASAAWPDHLGLHPVDCGCPISPDESLLLECIADSARSARKRFDNRLSEMINQSGRDKIWRAACAVSFATGWPEI